MSDASDIEWTDATWNPVRGCSKVSPGCKHCYAETFAERFRGVKGHPYELGFDPRMVPESLDIPLRWKKPRRIFVNSMSDLFGEFVRVAYIASVFGVMAAARHHTFQVLTKRAHRMVDIVGWLGAHDAEMVRETGDELAARMGWCHANETTWRWPLPNVHLGVSVEDKRYGLPRIAHLQRTSAALRFLSIEPLLEDLGTLDLAGIGWVILGGESGHGARPMQLDWMRSIVAQCRAAKVPVFVKQLGAAASDTVNGLAGARLRVPREALPLVKLRLKSLKGKDMAEWPADLQIQELPAPRAT